MPTLDLDEEVLSTKQDLSIGDADNIAAKALEIAAAVTMQNHDGIQGSIALYEQATEACKKLYLGNDERTRALKKELCMVLAKHAFINLEQQKVITYEYIEGIRQYAFFLFSLIEELNSPPQIESEDYSELCPPPSYPSEVDCKEIDARLCLMFASLIYNRVRQDQIELDTNQKASLQAMESAQKTEALAYLEWMNKHVADSTYIHPSFISKNILVADQLVTIAVQLLVDIFNFTPKNVGHTESENIDETASVTSNSSDMPDLEEITKMLLALSAHPACQANEAAMGIVNDAENILNDIAKKKHEIFLARNEYFDMKVRVEFELENRLPQRGYTPGYSSACKIAACVIPLVSLAVPVVLTYTNANNLAPSI